MPLYYLMYIQGCWEDCCQCCLLVLPLPSPMTSSLLGWQIFPAMAIGGTALGQAGSQVLAIIITLAMAVMGGLLTGQLGFYWTFLLMIYLN